MADYPVGIGFDLTTTPLHIFNSVITTGGSASIGAGGRNGTNGLSLVVNANLGDSGGRAIKTLPTTLSEIYYGFSWITNRLPSPGSVIVVAELRDAGAIQDRLLIRSDGTLAVYSGASAALLGIASGFAALANVHYHFKWGIQIHGSTAFVKLWVNDVLRLNLTNQDTQAVAGSLIASEIVLSCYTPAGGANNQAAQTTFIFDDVTVDNIDDFGDVEVREDLPTGTGATDQWAFTGSGVTSTRDAVDEKPPDEDTSFASEDTVGHTSLWTYPSIPTDADVKALILSPRVKKSAAGACQIVAVYRDAAGPTLHDFATKAPSDSSYEYHPDAARVNPATASAFTPTEINNGQYGVKRTA